MKAFVKKAMSSFLSTTLLLSYIPVKANNVVVASNASVSASASNGKIAAIKSFCSKATLKTKELKEVVISKEFLILASFLTILAIPGTFGDTPRKLNGNVVGETDAEIDKYDSSKIDLDGCPSHLRGVYFNDRSRWEEERQYSAEEEKLLWTKVNEILAEMKRNGCKTDYEKALFLHDYICHHCKYHNGSAGTPYHNNAYACLVDGSARCGGISEAYSVLCNKAGVECRQMHGICKSPNGHAWNIVKINGQWYHVDVTWDLPEGEYATLYKYFLLTKQEIERDHTPDLKWSY